MSLQGVTSGGPLCNCSGRHRIDCLTTAALTPHALVNNEGEVFYPDNDEDAAYFTEHHGAYPIAAYLAGARR